MLDFGGFLEPSSVVGMNIPTHSPNQFFRRSWLIGMGVGDGDGRKMQGLSQMGSYPLLATIKGGSSTKGPAGKVDMESTLWKCHV